MRSTNGCSYLPHQFHSRHVNLLAVSPTAQANPCLRAFALTEPSMQNALPPDADMVHSLTPSRFLINYCILSEAFFGPLFNTLAHLTFPVPTLSCCDVYLSLSLLGLDIPFFSFVCCCPSVLRTQCLGRSECSINTPLYVYSSTFYCSLSVHVPRVPATLDCIGVRDTS